MKFYVSANILNDGATKTWAQSFYVDADSIEQAIEKSKEIQSKYPFSKFQDVVFVTRRCGTSIGFSYTNPKYIVGK
jgi:hypothetical protein